SDDLNDLFTFDVDGDKVRLTPRDRGAAYLVLGWTSKEMAPAEKLPVKTGSASYPADSEFTVYRLEPIGRWPGGLPKPGAPQGIRCNPPGFFDCPIPPPPVPVGPNPPWPPKDQPLQELLRGADLERSGFGDR
ncbi:MAG TPA: hypothetical protein VFS60_14660, partial [Thermoanaerobaculia bacterium]|nr:hypothetical protein [Thermoanaerobaculia bacterium]